MPARELVVPKETVRRLLREATELDLLLVGGQALKLWVERYRVVLPDEFAYVSRDVDFLAPSAAASDVVRKLARALGGRAVFPRRRAALTALVGQAVKDVSDDEVFNVDVVHRVYGADEGLRARAMELRLGADLGARLMHPLDVLKSRLDNLHGLAEKRNELGKAQLRAAIAVAQAFQREALRAENAPGARRPTTLRYAAFVERLAASAAGKKVAARYGIHVADAIEPSAVPVREFCEKKLPVLGRLMSSSRRRELGLSEPPPTVR
ncbi:MAG: hypothetical protein KF819_17135 [Labilithrix sp.]|nr:hypothetical protein [Labilithrix sp.]